MRCKACLGVQRERTAADCTCGDWHPYERPSSMDLVREFHRVFGQAIADEPHITDRELNRLRLTLLCEELHELAEALGFNLTFDLQYYGFLTSKIDSLDALTDLQYVLDGAYLALGFHRYKDAALAEVHRSNLTKLDDNGQPVRRADGKIIKGPNYEPPDLASILSQGGERETRRTVNPVPEQAIEGTRSNYSRLAGSTPAPGTDFDNEEETVPR